VLYNTKVVQVWLCLSSYIANGYETTSLNHLIHDSGDNVNSVMLVAGCQSRQILRARVRKAFDLWQRTRKGFTFVFSGRNPSEKTIARKMQILNEAREMERYFYSLLEQPNIAQITYYTRRIDLDEESYNTVTNVGEFLKGDFLSRKDPNDIYLVSSSFHLIRLSQSFEIALRAMQEAVNMNNVVLVGAEDPDILNDVARNPNYVKSMMHEIYGFLLNESTKILSEGQGNTPIPSRFPWRVPNT